MNKHRDVCHSMRIYYNTMSIRFEKDYGTIFVVKE